ncbi:MAG: DUF4118 domain-containing protein [Gammaproteobacteria bacterium]|nr:DUF4118 domain-containing protein [Gammaproteobacteria bacterium]
MPEKRQSPEKLLQRVQEEERKQQRGKLKIYLGAAPGVGKTYEMLHDALEERSKGLDVVIGVVESHGRQEIESMFKNFETLPKQVIDYHGKKLLEFDLNAALKRQPGLILIDEMAHTNAPDLQHAKRWQDIKELLDRGINVYTTLNVQHIESLKDDVSQIIHAPIKETVPDSMIDEANTIELVDLPPDELLKRLHAGKIYIANQAELAAELFFREGNLIALRELALRTTAQRVGKQVLFYRQGQGISHIWPTKDKILVCVGPDAESLKLIRSASRMAKSLHAEWIAVYVDTSQSNISEEIRNNAIQNLRFAEQQGAETRVLFGFDIVKEVMNFAREENVTQIMLWRHIRKRWRDLVFRNLADEMVRSSGEIDVYIMTGEPGEVKSSKIIPSKKSVPWKIYGISMGIITLATIIDFLLYPFAATTNLVMVYLLGVTFISLFGQIGPSILASVLSVLAYDFFFIPPFYSFAVTDIQYFFTLIVMLLVAQVISQLTILKRSQAEAARLNERQTSILYKLSRQLARTRGTDKLLNTGVKYIAVAFNAKVIALLPKNNHLIVRSASNGIEKKLSPKEISIAQWSYDLGQVAGKGTDTLSGADSFYMPLIGKKKTLGVLQITSNLPNHLFTSVQMRLLDICGNQIALAIEVDRSQNKDI